MKKQIVSWINSSKLELWSCEQN